MRSVPVVAWLWLSTLGADGVLSAPGVYTTAVLEVEAGGRTRGKWVVGRFGEGHARAASGLLVGPTGTGCSAPLVSPYATPWIALVPGGGCALQVKVDNAVRSRAVGIIVYDDGNSTGPQLMTLSAAYPSK
ncbi:hypothetical protein AAG570_012540 [Ranatra chinensis]|uniref:PA domain-containing protein n=1 Tax=Ranatra chinensis TaxID=642074 RepID=A0ABD0YE78_9HEMI